MVTMFISHHAAHFTAGHKRSPHLFLDGSASNRSSHPMLRAMKRRRAPGIRPTTGARQQLSVELDEGLLCLRRRFARRARLEEVGALRLPARPLLPPPAELLLLGLELSPRDSRRLIYESVRARSSYARSSYS